MKSSKPIASKKALWRKKGFWAAILLLLAGGGGAAWYFLAGPNAKEAQAAAQTAAAGNTTKVARGDLQVTASGSGTLSAGNTVDLSFSTGGTVSSVNVKLGDTVTAGQELAQIDHASSLEANLALLQLQLLEAQKTLTDLQQNADVSLAQAYQDLVTAKKAYHAAVLAEQKTAYARCSQEVVTKYKAALDLAQSHLDQLRAHSYGTDAWINASSDYDTAKANYDYCASYSDDEKTSAKATVDVTRTTMDQAQARYETLQKSSGIDPDELALDQAKVDALQLQLDQAKEDLKGATLTAPIAGKVTYLASSAGTIVGTDKFMTLSDVSQPQIAVSVDESDMVHFVLGSSATVTFDAIPDQSFTGTVTLVQPSLTTSGQYKVLQGAVTLDENAAKTVKDLPLGLNASVSIVYQEAKDVLLVPVTALKQITGKGYQVSAISSDGTATMKSVEVGLIGSDYAEIKSGLNEGDTISKIVENASTTQSNAQDRGGMMPPDGGAGGPPPGP